MAIWSWIYWIAMIRKINVTRLFAFYTRADWRGLLLVLGSGLASHSWMMAGNGDALAQAVAMTPLNEQLVELDKIEALVNSVPITSKQIARLGFYGESFTLEKLIDSHLASQLGERFKMNVSDEDVDRYIQGLGMTPADVERFAVQWDYPSTAEFKQDLKIVYRGMGALKYELDSRLVITEAEIEAYYEAHPIMTETTYQVRTAYVPRNQQPLAVQQRALEQQIAKFQDQPEQGPWEWEPTIKILDSEISAGNGFLRTLGAGHIHLKSGSQGFDLFLITKVFPAGAVPLAERRNEIVRALQQQKHATVSELVRQDLRQQADIVYPIN